MSSLRRLPSVECAKYASPLPSSRSRNLSRILSLPTLSLCRQRHALPLVPPSLLCPSPSPSKRDDSRRKLTSCLSMPVWAADQGGDRTMRSISHSIAADEALDIQESVVYKDLCESIHLQIPGRSGSLSGGSEGVLQASLRDAGRLCRAEKAVNLSSSNVPISIRMLKRRFSSKPEVSLPHISEKRAATLDPCIPPICSRDMRTDNFLSHVPGSVNSAFGVLIFMMESLQQHALRLRNSFVSEADAQFQVMMERVRQEMQDTFLCLFQRVFACTPKLMLLTMILLADFTVHSMGGHFALAVPPLGEPPTYATESSVPASMLSFDLRLAACEKARNEGAARHTTLLNGIQKGLEPSCAEGGAGGGVARTVKIGGGTDGDGLWYSGSFDRAAITSQEETHVIPSDTSNAGSNCSYLEENQRLNAMWRQTLSKELIPDPLANFGHILVAPVLAPALEADDYICYDRTDLAYQHELSKDPSNPLLLANYAQFQHVVRHNYDRADQLYKRAVKADPIDGELMGKYASFLWVAKEDSAAADETYKAALAVEPNNAYHAGSYAHFLWSSGVDQDDVCMPNSIYREVSTS